MTRIYDDKGNNVPVTVVQAGPCAVTQVKNEETDGYNAVQLAFGEVSPKHTTMPLMGHCGKAGVEARRYFREIRESVKPEIALGSSVTVDIFNDVKFVDVTGTSKGKGFAGGMKRHHFGGQCASHGTERKHRSPGSLCSRAANRGFVGKPKKGLRMAGHMGMDRVTVQNHPLVKIDPERNLLLIKGALPGPNGSILFIRKAITAKIKAEAAK